MKAPPLFVFMSSFLSSFLSVSLSIRAWLLGRVFFVGLADLEDRCCLVLEPPYSPCSLLAICSSVSSFSPVGVLRLRVTDLGSTREGGEDGALADGETEPSRLWAGASLDSKELYISVICGPVENQPVIWTWRRTVTLSSISARKFLISCLSAPRAMSSLRMALAELDARQYEWYVQERHQEINWKNKLTLLKDRSPGVALQLKGTISAQASFCEDDERISAWWLAHEWHYTYLFSHPGNVSVSVVWNGVIWRRRSNCRRIMKSERWLRWRDIGYRA